MIEIVPCRLAHIRALTPQLRAEERIELAALGVEKPRHVLHSLWRDTPEPLAALCDGQVLACWGDAAPILAAAGLIWLFTSHLLEMMPISFAKIARQEIKRMLVSRETLRSSVHKSCGRALRFYEMLGFDTIEDTVRDGFVEIRISR